MRTKFWEWNYLGRRDIYKQLRSFVKNLPKNKQLKILDLGCGDKIYRPIFEKLNPVYIGVDINEGDEVDIVANAEDLPFENKVFDVIITTQVLEHVKNPQKVVSEIFRVLKKGGYVFCSAPMVFPVHGPPYDYWRFTEYGLRELFSKFKVRIKAPSGCFYTLIQLLNVNIVNFVPFRINKLQYIMYPFKTIFFIFNNLLALILDLLPLRRYGDGSFPLNYFVIAVKE